MSKKVIAFQMPNTSAPESESADGPARRETNLDQWVQRQGAADTRAEEQEPDAPVTIAISAVPTGFEVFRVGFLLPCLALSLWTLKAAERNLRLFSP